MNIKPMRLRSYRSFRASFCEGRVQLWTCATASFIRNRNRRPQMVPMTRPRNWLCGTWNCCC